MFDLYSVCCIPSLSNLEIKHRGKSYFVDKAIASLSSNYIKNQPDIMQITVPPVKGPFQDVIRFMNGQTIEAKPEDRLFFYLISLLFQIPSIELSFRPTPSAESAKAVFEFQREAGFRTNLTDRFLPFVSSALREYPDFTISPYIVETIMNSPQISNLGIGLTYKLLNMMLKESVNNCEAEKVVIKIIEKYPLPIFMRRILETEYFDISKISFLYELLLTQFTETNFPFIEGAPLNGFFCSMANKPDKKFSIKGSASSSPQFSIEKIFAYDEKSYYLTKHEKSPFFKITFINAIFYFTKYSIKVPDAIAGYPTSWSVFASPDFVNFEKVDDHFDDLSLSTAKIKSFSLAKNVHARAIKFVLNKSSDELNDRELSKRLVIENFEIFGCLQSTIQFENDLKYWSNGSDEDDVIFEKATSPSATTTTTTENGDNNSQIHPTEAAAAQSVDNLNVSDVHTFEASSMANSEPTGNTNDTHQENDDQSPDDDSDYSYSYS